MQDVQKKEKKSIDEKSLDFFIERLAEILLMQIDQNETEVKICKQGSLSESPEIIKPTAKLVVAK